MHFEKITYEQWEKDWWGLDRECRQTYDNIKLPQQGSSRSAGMDFFAPCNICLEPHTSITIPTGVRWLTDAMNENKVLLIVPRSGLGFKYGVRLDNTIGVIDADYYESDNEGHIIIRLHNPSDEPVIIEARKGFAQGIITQYCICNGSESEDVRNGGFGSTDKE